MIFNHYDDGSLVDCKIALREPIGILAESVRETETTPKPLLEPIVKMPQRAKRSFRRVRKARQSRGGRNNAIVLIGGVHSIAPGSSHAVRPQHSGP